MAKIGSMELIVILIVALFAIGPERLPKAARVLGKAVGSFKKYMNEATSELREVSEEFKDVETDDLGDSFIIENAEDEDDSFFGTESDFEDDGSDLDFDDENM